MNVEYRHWILYGDGNITQRESMFVVKSDLALEVATFILNSDEQETAVLGMKTRDARQITVAHDKDTGIFGIAIYKPEDKEYLFEKGHGELFNDYGKATLRRLPYSKKQGREIALARLKKAIKYARRSGLPIHESNIDKHVESLQEKVQA